jgi:predicted metal-dependent phosphoesterase TrpH
VEVSTSDGHLLCLGVNLPYLKHRSAAEVLALVHEQGGIAAPAHPYDRWRSGIRPATLDQLPLQAIEVFNAAVTSASYNDQAAAYAKNRGLVGWAGSDAHHAGAIGMAVTTVDIPELTLPAVLQALTCKVTREERYLSRRQGLQKHFANWFRFTKTQRPARPS